MFAQLEMSPSSGFRLADRNTQSRWRSIAILSRRLVSATLLLPGCTFSSRILVRPARYHGRAPSVAIDGGRSRSRRSKGVSCRWDGHRSPEDRRRNYRMELNCVESPCGGVGCGLRRTMEEIPAVFGFDGVLTATRLIRAVLRTAL